MLLSPFFFLPFFFHVCIFSIYQKAPDDILIRVQREVGLCGWHQPVESPGEGRRRRALNVQDSDVTVHSRKRKSSWSSRNGKGNTADIAFRKGVLAFVLSQPLKNCHSKQQIEIVSVIVQQVTVTELTKSPLILVSQQSLTGDWEEMGIKGIFCLKLSSVVGPRPSSNSSNKFSCL